jgi:hypothetical protein
VRVRRLLVSLYVLALTLALPAAALAAESQGDKPEGTDRTITTVFIVGLGIPAVLGLLALIDVARGKHTHGPGGH